MNVFNKKVEKDLRVSYFRLEMQSSPDLISHQTPKSVVDTLSLLNFPPRRPGHSVSPRHLSKLALAYFKLVVWLWRKSINYGKF